MRRSVKQWVFAVAVVGGGLAFASCDAGNDDASGGSASTGTNAGGAGSGTTTATGTTTGSAGQCTNDSGCAPGTICSNGACVAGCDVSHPCDGSNSCCSGHCFDLGMDLEHCGACDKKCDDAPNIDVQCNGMCVFGTCDMGFFDCDGNSANGCESTTACMCVPGTTQSCYGGPGGTAANPPCQMGMQTCNVSGNGWGPCTGQVLPDVELCSDGIDQDCNGTADDIADKDGDGWTICNGDCCDEVGTCGSNPAAINPGAFEVGGNMVDDDCDGTIDNALGGCDGGLASNSATAADYAKAMDLCQTTVENPMPATNKKWGVISAAFFRADGTGSPAANSRAIRTGFGSQNPPLAGASYAMLSTGAAAAQSAPNNASPAWVNPQAPSGLMGTSSGVPADWLAANGNNFPNAPGCPDPQGGTTANDPVMLKLRIRVPTNAQSFTVSSAFYSSEYPEWVCSPFNDFFLTLLDSSFVPGPGQTGNPADKNLAFYDPPPAGPPYFPVGVNLAFGSTGLFSQCKSGPTGCGQTAIAGNNTCSAGTAKLAGTGFDIANPMSPFSGELAYCGTNNLLGGGTGWLTTSGNVTPGETIEIRFVIWDTGDEYYDSDVLLDNWQWALTPTTPGTHG